MNPVMPYTASTPVAHGLDGHVPTIGSHARQDAERGPASEAAAEDPRLMLLKLALQELERKLQLKLHAALAFRT